MTRNGSTLIDLEQNHIYYIKLVSDEHQGSTNGLILHLAIETLVLCFNKISSSLQSVSTVTLADLVVQSHTVMMALEHAADAVVYFHNKFEELKILLRSV